MARCLPLDDVHPTQLYLSREKLAGVVEWFDFDDPNYGSLPAFKHEGTWYLSDGHTRAFAAALAGENTLRVERDDRVRKEFDFDVYLTCIDWCEEVDITSVRDLFGRIVEPNTYEQCWVDRCQAISD